MVANKPEIEAFNVNVLCSTTGSFFMSFLVYKKCINSVFPKIKSLLRHAKLYWLQGLKTITLLIAFNLLLWIDLRHWWFVFCSSADNVPEGLKKSNWGYPSYTVSYGLLWMILHVYNMIKERFTNITYQYNTFLVQYVAHDKTIKQDKQSNNKTCCLCFLQYACSLIFWEQHVVQRKYLDAEATLN